MEIRIIHLTWAQLRAIEVAIKALRKVQAEATTGKLQLQTAVVVWGLDGVSVTVPDDRVK